MDKWSEEIPESLMLKYQQLKYSHDQYQEMLQAGQLDLQTYLQMIQLTLAWTNLLSLNDSKNNQKKDIK